MVEYSLAVPQSLNLALPCVHAQSLQLCLTFCNPMECSPPGSSVCGIIQAGILEWVAIPSSRGSSQPKDWTHVSCIGRRGFFTTSTTWEALALLCDPVIPLLDTYPQNSRQILIKYTYVIFIALFTVVKRCKQPRCPSVDGCRNQMCCVCTVGYYSVIREWSTGTYCSDWTCRNIRLRGRVQTSKVVYHDFIHMQGQEWGKSMETKCRWVVTRRWGPGDMD